MKTAVIIAGGEGSRLKPFTDNCPKTLVKIAGKPMLYWLIEWLLHYKINHIVLGVSYKKEMIKEFIRENHGFGIDIDFSEHTLEGGTAEAFKLAISRHVTDKDFVAMNSDELTNMNLSLMMKKHSERKPIVTMALSPFYARFSVVKTDAHEMVSDFEYGKKLDTVPVSIGIYEFSSRIMDYLPDRGSIEDDVFKPLSKRNGILSYTLSDKEEWFSVNTVKDMADAERAINKWNEK
jgi:NDP-sugar pyrophosphorylase family protein